VKRAGRTLSRFFIEGSHAAGDEVVLDAGDAHKIRAVLRLGDGDSIETIDSAGVSFRGELIVAGESVRARLAEGIDRVSEPRVRIVLAQGIPKGQKMDFVVEKTTEIGVAAIVPFYSSRSAGERVGDAKLSRWRRIARSAAQQSGRQTIPSIETPVAWDELIDRFGEFERVVLAWEVASREPLRERLHAVVADVRSILLVIGPEGGLTHAEADAAQARGAALLSLGARILRTETAGLVACAAILIDSGDM
jgi:16S rRNA (uracil1498-N3)-methyltransferase